MSGSRLSRRVRPALFLLAAVAVLFAADRLLAAGVSLLVKHSDYRVSRIYAGTAKADVLLLGNSVGNAMAVPTELQKALGHKVFSLAFHGLDARTQKVLVDDLIARGDAPKVAILEIRSVMRAGIRAPELAPYQPFSPALTKLIDETDGYAVPWSRIFHTYGLNSASLVTILQKFVDRDDQSTGPSNGKINEAKKAKWRKTATTPAVVPEQLKAFLETAADLRAAGTRVVVIAAPLHPVTKGPWVDKMISQVRAALPADAVVLDYTQVLKDDAYFEDPTHLNSVGRKAFEPYLVEAARAGL